jgi:hypothetical protein
VKDSFYIANDHRSLQDVTAAYKTALSEKEALQKSVKLLNDTDKAANPSTTKTTTSALSPHADAPSNEHHEKISVLTNNIQVLIEAKSKLESNFQVERKKLKVFYLYV